jgi:hypothetical protein
VSYTANPNEAHEYTLEDLAAFLEGSVEQRALPEAVELCG